MTVRLWMLISLVATTTSCTVVGFFTGSALLLFAFGALLGIGCGVVWWIMWVSNRHQMESSGWRW
jgi:hypothetical protein